MGTNVKPTAVVLPIILSRTQQHEEQLQREETQIARLRRQLDRYLFEIEYHVQNQLWKSGAVESCQAIVAHVHFLCTSLVHKTQMELTYSHITP